MYMHAIFTVEYCIIDKPLGLVNHYTVYAEILTVILIWWFGESRKDHQINLHHYQAIYTTSMSFSTYSTAICQFKFLPIALFEQIPSIWLANNSTYTVDISNLYKIHW